MAAMKAKDQEARALAERQSVRQYGQVLDSINDIKAEQNMKRIQKELAYRDDLKKQIIQKRANEYLE